MPSLPGSTCAEAHERPTLFVDLGDLIPEEKLVLWGISMLESFLHGEIFRGTSLFITGWDKLIRLNVALGDVVLALTSHVCN